jgi:hypothetical protein
VFSGTPAPEVLCGLGGNDSIQAVGPGDIVIGGDGDDVLWASKDGSVLVGGPGNDRLIGESGSDLIQGGAGDDLLIGGASADTLEGGDGIDSLNGGLGDDSLSGGGGEDDLLGGPGIDTSVSLSADRNDQCVEVEVVTSCAFNVAQQPAVTLNQVDGSTGVSVQANLAAGSAPASLVITPLSLPTTLGLASVDHVAAVNIEAVGRSLVDARITFPIPVGTSQEDYEIRVQDRFGRWVEHPDVVPLENGTGLVATTTHFSNWGMFRRSVGPQLSSYDVKEPFSFSECLSPAFAEFVALATVIDSSGSMADISRELLETDYGSVLEELELGEMQFNSLSVNEVAPSEFVLPEFEAFGDSSSLAAARSGINSIADAESRVRYMLIVTDYGMPSSEVQQINALATDRKVGLFTFDPVRRTLVKGLPVSRPLAVPPSALSLGSQLQDRIFGAVTDTDKDSIRDCEEESGVIAYDFNDKAVPSFDPATHTSLLNPSKSQRDSDEDGLEDSVELLPAEGDPYANAASISLMRPVRFFASDPTRKNSDGPEAVPQVNSPPSDDYLHDAMEYMLGSDPRTKQFGFQPYNFLKPGDVTVPRKHLISRLNALVKDDLPAPINDSVSNEELAGYLIFQTLITIDSAHDLFKQVSQVYVAGSENLPFTNGLWVDLNQPDVINFIFDAAIPGWAIFGSDLSTAEIPKSDYFERFFGKGRNFEYRRDLYTKLETWLVVETPAAAATMVSTTGYAQIARTLGGYAFAAAAVYGLGATAGALLAASSPAAAGAITEFATSQAVKGLQLGLMGVTLGCIGSQALLEGKKCPKELTIILDIADLAFVGVSAFGTFGTVSKLRTLASTAPQRVNRIRMVIRNRKLAVEVEEATEDALGLSNDMRVDQGLDPLTPTEQPIVSITDGTDSIDVPVFNAGGLEEGFVASAQMSGASASPPAPLAPNLCFGKPCSNIFQFQIDIWRRIKTNRAIISAKSAKYAPHKTGAIGEQASWRWRSAPTSDTVVRGADFRSGGLGTDLKGAGENVFIEPGLVNKPGIDIASIDRRRDFINVIDVKASRRGVFRSDSALLAKVDRMLKCGPLGTGGKWCKELWEAILSIPNQADRTLAIDLYDRGQIRGQVDKWSRSKGLVASVTSTKVNGF